jgi:MATE family multidrug resistance protein
VQAIYSVYKPYFKSILKLSWPIIIGQLGIVLMGVADTLMIGKIDATNLAAAGLANAIYYLITILGLGTLMAVSPLIAKAKAENNLQECVN